MQYYSDNTYRILSANTTLRNIVEILDVSHSFAATSSAPLDISSLLDRLLQTGIISKPEKRAEEPVAEASSVSSTPVPVSISHWQLFVFTPDSLTVINWSIVSLLFSISRSLKKRRLMWFLTCWILRQTAWKSMCCISFKTSYCLTIYNINDIDEILQSSFHLA